MNHNCSAVLAIDPTHDQQFDLSEDARDQRLLSRRWPRRPAARKHPAARAGHRPDPEDQPPAGAGMGARRDEPAHRRLVCDERGPAQSREPRDSRGRADSARLEAQQLGGSRRIGRRRSRIACARRATRSCFRSRSTAERLRISAARFASALDPATAPLDPFCRAFDHPEPLRRRRLLPADLGCGQSVSDDRRAGASRRRPRREKRPLIIPGCDDGI